MKVLVFCALVALVYVGSALAQVAGCVEFSAVGSSTIRITGMCADWKLWILRSDLFLVCPGTQPPFGAIELREYYQLGDRENQR